MGTHTCGAGGHLKQLRDERRGEKRRATGGAEERQPPMELRAWTPASFQNVGVGVLEFVFVDVGGASVVLGGGAAVEMGVGVGIGLGAAPLSDRESAQQSVALFRGSGSVALASSIKLRVSK